VPPAPPPLVAPVGVVAVLVVGGVVVGLVGALAAPEVVGALATDTVLVVSPQPPSRTVIVTARVAIAVRRGIGRVIGCMVLRRDFRGRTS
jgi:hypothetical protein